MNVAGAAEAFHQYDAPCKRFPWWCRLLGALFQIPSEGQE
jgi:hypothetical protein